MVDVGRLIGQTINSRYEVRELLGKGGSGHVYKAFDIVKNRFVALKIYKYVSADDSESIIRFEKEVAVYDKLQNEHCAQLYDHGVSQEGYLVLAMEFLQGRPLGQVIADEAPLEAGRAVALTCQILEALIGAHQQGIVHRDLKPDNVFLIEAPDGSELVKVLDFGIAKFLESEAMNETLSRDGFIFGTPQYICPEQALGWQVSPASDIYSLGVVLFEMLTGTPPFQSDTPMGLGMKHIYEPPPLERLSAADPVLRALRGVLAVMMEKRPERRPTDARDALNLLRSLGHVPMVRFDVVGSSGNGTKATPNVPTVRARPVSSEVDVAAEELAAGGEAKVEVPRPPTPPPPSPVQGVADVDEAAQTMEEPTANLVGHRLQRLSTGSEVESEQGLAGDGVEEREKGTSGAGEAAMSPKVAAGGSSEPWVQRSATDSQASTQEEILAVRSSDRLFGYGLSGEFEYSEELPQKEGSGIPPALWVVLVLGLLLVSFVLYALLVGPSAGRPVSGDAVSAGIGLFGCCGESTRRALRKRRKE